MTVIELKSQAYDCMMQIEIWKQRLADTSKMIAEEVKKEKAVKVVEKTIEEPKG